MGFAAQRLLKRRYCELSGNAVNRLIEKYDIAYIVRARSCRGELHLPVVYRDARYTLYETGVGK